MLQHVDPEELVVERIDWTEHRDSHHQQSRIESECMALRPVMIRLFDADPIQPVSVGSRHKQEKVHVDRCFGYGAAVKKQIEHV